MGPYGLLGVDILTSNGDYMLSQCKHACEFIAALHLMLIVATAVR